MKHTLSELKQLIAAKLDLDEIFDILGWDIPEFLEVIEEYITDNQDEFEEAVQ